MKRTRLCHTILKHLFRTVDTENFSRCLLTTQKYTWLLTSSFVITNYSFAIYEKKLIQCIRCNQHGFISSLENRMLLFFGLVSLALPNVCQSNRHIHGVFAVVCKPFLFTLMSSWGNLDYNCLLSACPRPRQRLTIIVNGTSEKIWHCSARFITMPRVNTF